MKEKRPALAVYGLLLTGLVFTLGYLLGSGRGETQVQVTVTEPILVQQTAEQPVLSAEAVCLDLNTATQEQLESLPGIGPELAGRILQYRQSCGGFVSTEQLMDVKGIGEKRYTALKELISVGGIK